MKKSDFIIYGYNYGTLDISKMAINDDKIEYRRQGIATDMMTYLLEEYWYAESVELYPKPDANGMSKERLIQFYQDFRFGLFGTKKIKFR